MKLKELFGNKKEDPDSSHLSSFLKHMIKGVEKLAEKVATDIMIPRVDTTTIQLNQPIKEVVKVMKAIGFSRYPVWEEKLDNIIGVLYVKDILYRLNSKGEAHLLKENSLTENMIRKPFFIPETKKVESLLKEFLKKKVHLAIVIDEHGGFSGIVTLENIVEIIIGDIQDEYDFEQEPILKVTDNMYEIDARTLLEDLEEALKIDFSNYKGEIDTLGGLIYNLFDRVPSIGEQKVLDDITYIVTNTEGTKIKNIKIKLKR